MAVYLKVIKGIGIERNKFVNVIKLIRYLFSTYFVGSVV